MKKTITLLAFAFAAVSAQAGTNTTYWAEATGGDLLKIEGPAFPYLSNESATMRLDKSALTALTTQGDTTYTLLFNGTGDASFSVNDAIYFDSVVTKNASAYTNYTIDFGTEGSITTAQNFNFGSGTHGGSVAISASFDAETLALISSSYQSGTANTFSRDLIVANGNYGIWNLGDSDVSVTLSSAALSQIGLGNAGFVKSADDILFGQFGLVYTDTNGKDTLTLVVKTPEPATATLSLLALAGLAARRRRH